MSLFSTVSGRLDVSGGVNTMPVVPELFPPYDTFPSPGTDDKPDSTYGYNTVSAPHTCVTDGADFEATFGLHLTSPMLDGRIQAHATRAVK